MSTWWLDEIELDEPYLRARTAHEADITRSVNMKLWQERGRLPLADVPEAGHSYQ